MIVALIILAVAIVIVHRAKKLCGKTIENNDFPTIKKLSVLVFVFTIVQVMIGTQVREQVDVLLKNFDRNQVINALGTAFNLHRIFSVLILATNFLLIRKIIKSDVSRFLKKCSIWLGVFLFVELLAGITLSGYNLPAIVQPIHLLLACIIFGLQFVIILKVLRKQE